MFKKSRLLCVALAACTSLTVSANATNLDVRSIGNETDMMTETVHMLDPESGESLLSTALEDTSTDKAVRSAGNYDVKKADVQKFVDYFLNAQYNALITSDHAGMKSFFSDNDVTAFYLDCFDYRIDSAFATENYWTAFDYEWNALDFEVDGDELHFTGDYFLNFTYVSNLDGCQPIHIQGTLTLSPEMKISQIDTNEIFYADLKENLSSHGLISLADSNIEMLSLSESGSDSTVIVSDEQEVTSFLSEMLDAVTTNFCTEQVESKEVILANPVMARTRYSYDADEGVRYANRWWNSYNPQFYRPSQDCTNFVSQCVWAAYGEHMEPSTSLSQWFAHKNGAGTPWENVSSFWNYCTKSRQGTQTGPRANGYNNGGNYTGVPAYAMIPGNVVQLQFPSDNVYGHSLYIVDNNATNYNNYGGVIYTQHQRPGKGSIQDKINTYGSDLKIRRLNFIAAYF